MSWPRGLSPVGVVRGQRVGDQGPGHQQEGPHQKKDAAGRQHQDAGAERDSLLVQNLEKIREQNV